MPARVKSAATIVTWKDNNATITLGIGECVRIKLRGRAVEGEHWRTVRRAASDSQRDSVAFVLSSVTLPDSKKPPRRKCIRYAYLYRARGAGTSTIIIVYWAGCEERKTFKLTVQVVA